MVAAFALVAVWLICADDAKYGLAKSRIVARDGCMPVLSNLD